MLSVEPNVMFFPLPQRLSACVQAGGLWCAFFVLIASLPREQYDYYTRIRWARKTFALQASLHYNASGRLASLLARLLTRQQLDTKHSSFKFSVFCTFTCKPWLFCLAAYSLMEGCCKNLDGAAQLMMIFSVLDSLWLSILSKVNNVCCFSIVGICLIYHSWAKAQHECTLLLREYSSMEIPWKCIFPKNYLLPRMLVS